MVKFTGMTKQKKKKKKGLRMVNGLQCELIWPIKPR